ncbi:tRNA (adenosine(37)-N6)-threonylcarbamoyltransferase complex transferase subunit TsaD [Candidatus Falkowbacteria bacterium]|nr:tRNA (adenosine(37)-N6)-threonylcarbamoyltransferase complex transferase subunit TsaD [Candidatus Falkowbacteria bacterium]
MKILGIETSCDETAAAVAEIRNTKFEILNNVIASQEKIHAKFGGIVPEVAARKHIEMMLLVLEKATVGLNLKKDIDAIAVTAGPGLVTSLTVGVETAKTLAIALNKPLVAVNHIEAHALAGLITTPIPNFKFQISNQCQSSKSKALFPAVCLVVSGGHTQIILVEKIGKYKVVGETLDDAAGEAFDKAAKIMGLGYPGGPAIAARATQFPISNFQFPIMVKFPRPMMNSGDFNFSFAGLKTAILYKWKELSKDKKGKELDALKIMFAKEFQDAVVDVMVGKTIAAAEKFHAKTVMLGGGVAANKALRETLANNVEKYFGGKVGFIVPDLKYCTDNAAMVAFAGYFKFLAGKFVDPFKLRADPNLEL